MTLGLDLRDRCTGAGKCLAVSFQKPRKSSSPSSSLHLVPLIPPLSPFLSCNILKQSHGPSCRCFRCSETVRDQVFPPEVSNTPSFHLHRKKHPGWQAETAASPQWALSELAHDCLCCWSGAVLAAPRISATSPLFPTGSLIAQICKERRHTSTCRTCR